MAQVQTIRDYGQSNGSFTATFTQAGGYSQTSLVKYRVINRTVTLRVQGFQGTTTAAAGFLSGATDMPRPIRPPNAVWFPVAVQNSGAMVGSPGLLEISATGLMGVYKDLTTAAFTNGATGGLIVPGLTVHVTYLLD